jgi:hypothetical protein
MTALDDLLDSMKQVLTASREQVTPEERVAFDAGSLSAILQCIQSLRRTAADRTSGSASEIDRTWSVLNERAETEYERALRETRTKERKSLESPPDETTYSRTLLWQGENGGEEELAIIRRQHQAPPYSTPDVLDLLAKADQKICERLSRPLPEPVRQSACFYLRYKLGDALTVSRSGVLVSTAEGERRWLVKVHRGQTDQVIGELRISEDSSKVEWIPARKV